MAHHLDGWANFPDQRYDLDNGVTLCTQHHDEFHNSLGGSRLSCTRAQYTDFKTTFYLADEIKTRRAAQP